MSDPRKATLGIPVDVPDDSVVSLAPAEISVVMVGDEPVTPGEPPPGPDHVGIVLGFGAGEKPVLVRLRSARELHGLCRRLIEAGRFVWPGGVVERGGN